MIQDRSTNVQMDFTGQHRCVFQGDDNTNLNLMIVITTGTYYNLDKSDKPFINDSIPIVTLSTTIKDKKVFGVISDKEDSNNYRKTNTGNFVSLYDKTDETDRVFINSLGEGAIWVCNEQGNLGNGDYECTSSVPGIGFKQIAPLLR